MSESGDRALEILADVLEAPEDRRGELLDTACAGEPALRAEVERLMGLGLGARAKEFLDALEPAHRPAHELPRFGRYRALRLIGEGGMGSVYEAEQEHPRRHVAVKVVKLGMDTRRVIARFEAEREALGLMDHPNIARVLDAGVTDTGRPFFVMELVKGVPITAYCDGNALGIRQRLELFISVCRAVQHAHQKAIIHRDLKPSNVLVTLQDGAPVPKVIDFGIAKATGGQRLTEQTLLTEFRQLVGTPEYTSPEQAEMSGIDIDTRSDIYSLGVLLYELLTGVTPFDRDKLRGSNSGEVWRLIRETEPEKPSTRLGALDGQDPRRPGATVAKSRGTDHLTLVRTIRGELDWIAMKCLEKDRTRRYETANALALDVQRYLDDEPVSASPPRLSYRVGKVARKYKVMLAAAALVVVALVLGIIGTSVGLVRARAAEHQANAQRVNAEREAAKASAVSKFLRTILADPERSGDADARLVDMLDRATAEVGEKLKGQPEVEVQARLALFNAYWSMELRPQLYLNLRRAFELVRETHGEDTEHGIGVMILMVDWYGEFDEYEWRPDLPDRVALAHKVAADARRVLGDHDLTLHALVVLGGTLHVSGRLPEAETVLREAVRIKRTRPDAYIEPFYYLGNACAAQGKLEEAEAALRDSLRELMKRPGQSNDRRRLRVSAHLAHVLIDRGKEADAAAVYREALAACRPRLGDVHTELKEVVTAYSNLLKKLGRRDEAARLEADIREGLTLLAQRPAGTAAALERRGLALIRLGQFKAAAEDYARVIELNPDNHDAWGARAHLLAQIGDRKGYEAHCRRMLERFGRNTNRTIAERTAKMCLVFQRPADQARALLELTNRSVDGERPHDYLPWFLMAKGMAEYRAGHPEEAIVWLNRSRETLAYVQGHAMIDLFLAMSYHRLGRPEDALALLDRGARIIETSIPPSGSGNLGAGLTTSDIILVEANALILGIPEPEPWNK